MQERNRTPISTLPDKPQDFGDEEAWRDREKMPRTYQLGLSLAVTPEEASLIDPNVARRRFLSFCGAETAIDLLIDRLALKKVGNMEEQANRMEKLAETDPEKVKKWLMRASSNFKRESRSEFQARMAYST